MATNPEHGTAGILADIGAGEPAGKSDDAGLIDDDADHQVEPDLFGDAPLLPTLKMPDGTERQRSGPGRPPGSKNRSTQQLINLITHKYGHPVLRLAELAATPIDVLAKTLNCSMLEAAEFSRKVQNDVAVYVAHKLPQSLQVELKTAGKLAIYLGNPADADGNVHEHALDMDVIEGEKNSEEKQ